MDTRLEDEVDVVAGGSRPTPGIVPRTTRGEKLLIELRRVVDAAVGDIKTAAS